MATYKELKKKFIDHLMGVDLYKMNITDLYTYACILKTVDEEDMMRDADDDKTRDAIRRCMEQIERA